MIGKFFSYFNNIILFKNILHNKTTKNHITNRSTKQFNCQKTNNDVSLKSKLSNKFESILFIIFQNAKISDLFKN